MQKLNLPSWLQVIKDKLIAPRLSEMHQHPFMLAMQNGEAKPDHAQHYFSGLAWHLSGFDAMCTHLFQKRPAAVGKLLEGRAEDTGGDVEILMNIVKHFGGPVDRLQGSMWSYQPHPVWVRHDSLLRAAIYSPDLEWQVGTAALNIGIETLVPHMIAPLYQAAVENYGVSTTDARWLESRSGEEEIQHGDNGYIILSEFIEPSNQTLIDKCSFYIDKLSDSMSRSLLSSGLADGWQLR